MAVEIDIRYERSPVVVAEPRLQSYDLVITALSATEMPTKIFQFQERPDDTPVFRCISDPVDLEEVPEDTADIGNEMPYYRVDNVRLRFRTLEALSETKDLIAEDIQRLVNSLKAAQDVELLEEVTYG